MGKATFELSVLLSLKDVASGRLDSFRDKLRATGKDGRAALQDYEELRKSLQRKLVVGGVATGIGIAGLAGLKSGVDAAGDFEDSLLDLKGAYQEAAGAGALSATQQAAQLNSLAHLATRMGNDLQGSSADYVGILTSLKRAGVDAKTVLEGAGEAASHLANVSGAVRRGTANEQAKELGQFGIMFDLKPRDFVRQVDLFSALKDRFDIESSELIESAKYFQSTAKSLRLTGFEGATETSKFFALLKRRGALEGSQAGTSGTSFFQQFIAKGDQRAKIKKTTGLDIKLFDAKGEFAGFENAFREMEKFRKFSAEKRLGLLNEIFGEQGGKVAGVMVEAGAEGWRNVSIEAAKAVPVQEKINQQMATYNAKMEALQGTLSNIKATTFTPMLDTVKPLLDTTNQLLGSLQNFTQANPGVASAATHLLGVGSAGLVAYGSVRTLTTGWRLWRLASELSTSDALVAYLKKVAAGADDAGTGLTGAGTKATALKGRLSALSASPFKITLLLATVGFTLHELFELKKWLDERQKATAGLDKTGAVSGNAARRASERAVRRGEGFDTQSARMLAGGALTGLQEQSNRYLEFFLDPSRQDFYTRTFTLGANPFGRFGGEARQQYLGNTDPEVRRRIRAAGGYDAFERETSGAMHIKRRAPELGIPEVMAEFRKQVASLNLSEEMKASLNRMLQTAYPESFSRATLSLTQELTNLGLQGAPLSRTFAEMVRPAESLPGSLKGVVDAASLFSLRLRGINFEPVYFPAPAGAQQPSPAAPPQPSGRLNFLPSIKVPSRAIGGDVIQSGFVNVHRGEEIVPASVTSGLRRGPIQSLLALAGGTRNDKTTPTHTTQVITLRGEGRRAGDLTLTKSAPPYEPGSIHSLLTLGNDALNGKTAPTQTTQIMALRGEGRRAGGAALTKSASAYEPTLAHAATRPAAGVRDIKLEVNINLPSGARAADDPEALALLVEERVGRKIAELKALLSDPRFIERLVSHEVEIQRERA